MATTSLTEAAIVDAALKIIRRAGVDGLSMRGLSRELGVSPMAAYYYVRNKEELLELVAARALANITAPTPVDLAWPVRLRMLIDRIDAALRRNRGVGEVLLDRMHGTQQHVMRAVMEILSEAGFSDADVAKAYAMIHTYLFGRYRVVMSTNPEQTGDPADAADIVSRVGPLTQHLRGQDYYDFGVDTLIRGLQTRVPAAVGAAGAAQERNSR
jgi:TetR/AcrR family transcriptional regulator, tetracycline repressor protein